MAKGQTAWQMLPDGTPLLEFLQARDLAQWLLTSSSATKDHKCDVWTWIWRRMAEYCPQNEFPRQVRDASSLELKALLQLLCHIHVISTYAYTLRFSATRRGSAVRFADQERFITNWGIHGGSIFGDVCCVRNGVSYWECRGLSEGSYVGIAEETASATSLPSGIQLKRQERMLSLPTPACDSIPAIMYCESGFITNGSFFGKPRLPAGVKYLQAEPFKENDRVGVLVDLMEDTLLFLLNDQVQGIPIPIDKSKTYIPLFSARACYHLELLPNLMPPWHIIYPELLSYGLHHHKAPPAHTSSDSENATAA